MTSTYNAFAAAHLDGTIMIASTQVGLLCGVSTPGVPLATFRINAGMQSHPAYALARSAIKVFAYAEAARLLGIESLQVTMRANLISAEAVTVLVSDGEIDIECHGPSDVRKVAEGNFARMTSGKADFVPTNWPETPMTLPIPKPSVVHKR